MIRSIFKPSNWRRGLAVLQDVWIVQKIKEAQWSTNKAQTIRFDSFPNPNNKTGSGNMDLEIVLTRQRKNTLALVSVFPPICSHTAQKKCICHTYIFTHPNLLTLHNIHRTPHSHFNTSKNSASYLDLKFPWPLRLEIPFSHLFIYLAPLIPFPYHLSWINFEPRFIRE